MRDLKDKTVFVSASADGIGKAIARAFAMAGSRVFINGRSAERLAATAAELGTLGSVTPVVADLSQADALDAVMAALPDGQLDFLVNNLGIFETRDFFETTDDYWRQYFEVNVMSAVRLARAAATLAGSPAATTRPPSSPAPGPMSMIQSLPAATCMSCSTTITVLPASTRPSSCFIRRSTSAGCSPVVGSSST